MQVVTFALKISRNTFTSSHALSYPKDVATHKQSVLHGSECFLSFSVHVIPLCHWKGKCNLY